MTCLAVVEEWVVAKKVLEEDKEGKAPILSQRSDRP